MADQIVIKFTPDTSQTAQKELPYIQTYSWELITSFLPFLVEPTWHRWFPLTKGQWCGGFDITIAGRVNKLSNQHLSCWWLLPGPKFYSTNDAHDVSGPSVRRFCGYLWLNEYWWDPRYADVIKCYRHQRGKCNIFIDKGWDILDFILPEECSFLIEKI